MATSSQGNQDPNFKSMSGPSTKMLAIVSLAILIGFILVWIVNDKSTTKTTAKKSAVTTTTIADSKNKTTTSTSSTTTTTVANTQKASGVSVLVLNGSSFAGVAKNTSTEIGKVGYKMLTAGDDSSKDVGTFVYYKTGFQPDAEKIAKNILPNILKVLQIPQTVKVEQFPSSTPSGWAVSELLNANVVVIIGNQK